MILSRLFIHIPAGEATINVALVGIVAWGKEDIRGSFAQYFSVPSLFFVNGQCHTRVALEGGMKCRILAWGDENFSTLRSSAKITRSSSAIIL